jgi:HK97 family phage portal protein
VIARRIAQGLETRDWTLSEHTPELAALFGGPPSYSGESVSVEGTLGLIPVYAAVNVIASTIGVMPMHVYRRLERGREKATDTWQYRLFHEYPNPEMAPGQFVETALVHQLLWGNVYFEKVKGSFAGAPRVMELWPITPSRVKVTRRKRDGAKVFEIDGGRQGDDYTGGGDFTEAEILHIPALGYDGTCGMSPVSKARQEIGGALARQKFQGGLYKRGAKISGILKRPATAPKWSPEASARFKDQWRSWYEGGGSQEGGTPVLQDGMEYQEIGMPLKDQQFIEQNEFTTTQIATLFNMPASKINGQTGDSLTYGNREQDAQDFITFTCLPWMTRLTQGFWRDTDLFPSRTFYPALVPEGLLRGDSAQRSAFYKAMHDLHVLTPNDIAEMEDRPVRPGGDEFIKTPAPPAPAAQQGAEGGADENEDG